MQSSPIEIDVSLSCKNNLAPQTIILSPISIEQLSASLFTPGVSVSSGGFPIFIVKPVNPIVSFTG